MNLAWKEFRESYPIVLMAVGVLVIGALYPRFFDTGGTGMWAYTYNLSGSAIFLFISLVLGVTAYALEAEQDTLTTLRSKPVPENDILATKIGVRMGLLTLAVLVFGILEMASHAWPVIGGVPSTVEFLRWSGTLALSVLGFGTGLYFGRARRQQTDALLSAGLVIGVGYVILNLSPLGFIFDDTNGIYPLFIGRGITIPALVGILFATAAIREPRTRDLRLPRWLIGTATVGLYGIVIWSFSVVPSKLGWTDSGAYQAFWSMRFGTHEQAIAALVDRQYLSAYGDAVDEERARALLDRTNGIGRVDGESLVPLINTPLLANRGHISVPARALWSESHYPVIPLGEVEEFFVRHHDPGWFSGLLEDVRARGAPYIQKMYAIHAAGVAGHPEVGDALADLLQDDGETVRLMAARVLDQLGDPRGREAIISILPGIRYWRNFYAYSDLRRDWTPQQMEALDALFTEWIEEGYAARRDGRMSGNVYDLIHRRVSLALSWFELRGNAEDAPVVRRGVWAIGSSSRIRQLAPEDLEIRDYRRTWADPSLFPELLRETREQIARHLSNSETIRDLFTDPGLKRPRGRLRTDQQRARWDRQRALVGEFRELRDDLVYLLDHQVPGAFRAWQEARPLLDFFQQATYSITNLGFLPSLARWGPEGLDELERLFTDTGVPVETRVQAGLLLVEADRNEYAGQLLHLIELFGEQSSYVWLTYVPDAVTALIAQGHGEFIGYMLGRADRALKTEKLNQATSAGRESVGTWFWNDRLAEALHRGTGQDFGWDLKAWTTWWEREGTKSSVGVNQ